MTTGSNSLWKLSEGSTYDNIYNFEPAVESTPNNFEISNGSQFVWFKSQIYNGRTTINAKLTADIDMTGISDPYTFYVYDTNISAGKGTEGRKYEAHYAYRGCFDGQQHTINNINIQSTPYYNSGLFPYVVNGTIKNVTALGSIKLTKANHNSQEVADIKNVGFIGYMNGGTLENINLINFNLNTNSVPNPMNCNKLVGYRTGRVYISNCILEPVDSTSNSTDTTTVQLQ